MKRNLAYDLKWSEKQAEEVLGHNVQEADKDTRQEKCSDGGREPAPDERNEKVLESQSDDLASKEGHAGRWKPPTKKAVGLVQMLCLL